MRSFRFILALLLVLVSLQGPVPAPLAMVAASATTHCDGAGCGNDHAVPVAQCCPSLVCHAFVVPLPCGAVAGGEPAAAFALAAADHLSGRDISPEPGPPRHRT